MLFPPAPPAKLVRRGPTRSEDDQENSMMKSTLSLTLALSLGLGAAACSKKEEAAAAPSGGGAAPAGKAAEPAKAGGAVKIESLKLQFDGPADATSNDMSMGGPPAVMVSGTGLVFNVGEVGPTSPATFEQALDAAKIYDGATFTKQEKTADGWHIEFNNTGSMGANYFVEIRRTVGGRPITCGTTAPSTELAAATVKACQSLRPL
jgi:hypothetical protein